MRRLIGVFSRFAEGVAAMMMAAMFLTFLLQIAVRYVVGSEWFAARLGHVVDASAFGWTLEFCLAMWLWIVFWGNAFIVRERDHVTFDILYLAASPTVRRWLAAIGAAVIVIAFLSSILPTWDKLRILRLKSSATLPVKMLPIYSIYFVFLVAVAARYAWRFRAAVRGRTVEEGHHHLEIRDE
ncbi:MAG TPA: TRAP transporter small permease subunit [Methylomirabilota bacterium]|nr:TRAP transporter small permease subunit [Methylomirabilota bacterium]